MAYKSALLTHGNFQAVVTYYANSFGPISGLELYHFELHDKPNELAWTCKKDRHTFEAHSTLVDESLDMGVATSVMRQMRHGIMDLEISDMLDLAIHAADKAAQIAK